MALADFFDIAHKNAMNNKKFKECKEFVSAQRLIVGKYIVSLNKCFIEKAAWSIN